MKVLVVGAGAIGSIFGACLTKSGHEVTLLGRSWHVDAIRRNGLSVSGLWGNFTVTPSAMVTQFSEIARVPFDWILVCVKAHQTERVAAEVAAHLSPDTLVCAVQNGLGNFEALAQHMPEERIALGRIISGVEITPGHVQVTVSADHVRIGSPRNVVPMPRLTALAQTLTASGIPTDVTPAILQVIWAKVLYNAALNGLSALFEVPYGALGERELTRRLMTSILEEAYAVAAAHHILLEPPRVAAYLRLFFNQLIPDTAAHHSSMVQDLQRGRRTEIDAMNGAIAQLGEAVGIETPANTLVTKLVHAKERWLGL